MLCKSLAANATLPLRSLTPLTVPCPIAPTELPPLDEMVRRSTALSPEHEQLVRSFLAQCQSYRYYDLADELVRLDGLFFQTGLSYADRKEVWENIDLCMREFQKVRELIKAYRPLLPKLYVPPEIWTLIFRHCMPNPYLQDFETNLPTSPVYLSAVCSRWQRIVHNDPYLWSIIRISVPRKPHGWLHTSKHVSNSATKPLHVYVSNTKNTASKDDVSLITEFIASTAHRWRTLHYLLAPYSAASLPFRDAHMPALDYLVVECVPTWWTDPPAEPRTPNLRHLVLRPKFQEGTTVLDINSPQLKELDVTCFPHTDFFNHFFPCHPQLVRLKITVPNRALEFLLQGAHMKKVFLEHLEFLQVIIPARAFEWNHEYTNLKSEVIPFLRGFSLPSLRRLELLADGRGFDSFQDFDLLIDHLATLQPPLQSLSMRRFGIIPPRSVQYARAKLSSLQILDV